MAPKIGHRDLLSIHQDRLEHHQANLNELTTNALRNPLREHLDISGFDIKNARRIQTSNSLQVGTSVTVGNSITINENIALGGNIMDLDGNVLTFGGGGGGGGTGPLLDNYPDFHVVKNGIGDITTQTTVEDLKLNNSDITEIIAKMLRIEAPSRIVPTIFGASFTITTSNAHVKLNDPFPPSITLRFNRGTWLNAFQLDGTTPASTLPHNPGNLAILNSGFGFNGTNSNPNIETTGINNSSPSEVYYKENLPSGNFNSWGDVTLNATMLTSTNSTGVVYNNYSQEISAPTNQIFNTTKIWSVYKPVFLDNETEVTISRSPGNTAGSNPERGTVKVFSNTTYIIYINHNWGETMEIPFRPRIVQQYDNSFTNSWYDVQFTVTTLSSDYKGYGQYYQVALNINQRSIAIDVKISI